MFAMQHWREQRERVALEDHTWQPKTQKARGLQYLNDLTSLAVPHFTIWPSHTVADYNLSAKGQFVRPCPRRPRHGFVESRVAPTTAAFEQVIDETLKADIDGEAVIMPFIDAEYSAVITPGMMTLARGHAGATGLGASKSYRTPWDNYSVACVQLASVEEAPYIECVIAGGQAWAVQLRDGPKQTGKLNFVPAAFPPVARVIVGSQVPANLIRWEAMAAEFGPGTVLWIPDRSLACHAAIHAILNGIAVMTMGPQPKIGAVLRAASNKLGRADISGEDFDLGYSRGLEVEYGNLETQTLAALAVVHGSTLWQATPGVRRAWGFAAGTLVRLTLAACIGETRHWYSRGPGMLRSIGEYPTPCGTANCDVCAKALKKYAARKADQIEPIPCPIPMPFGPENFDNTGDGRILCFKHAFPIPALELDGLLGKMFKGFSQSWNGAYGGASWANAANRASIINRMVQQKRIDRKMFLSSLNKLAAAVHNSGSVLGKFVDVGQLNRAAYEPAFYLLWQPLLEWLVED